MEIVFILIAIALLLFFGLRTIWLAEVTNERSYVGHRAFAKMSKWNEKQFDVWSVFPINRLLSVSSRIVFIDEAAETLLIKKLSKAGLTITPRQYTAKKYLIIAFGALLMTLCVTAKFYLGIVPGLLITVYLLMKQSDTLTERIKQKDSLIAQEMPGFVRTICRNLQSDRDIHRVIATYRKVSGVELGAELDILLAEMQAGNTQNALAHFENRIGTPESFRLCGALRDMSMGIDQTATLSYLADSMASQAKENIRKELSLRPGKMRRTYYPAIAICIAMIMYVLVVYVINNLNNLF